MPDIENNSSRRSGFITFLIAAFLVFLLFLCFGKGNNLVQWAKAKSELRRQEKQKELYLKEIDEMNKRIEMIKSDKDTLERVAREKFHFAAPGEDVYVIE